MSRSAPTAAAPEPRRLAPPTGDRSRALATDPTPASRPTRSGARTALVIGLALVAALVVVVAAILVPRVVDNLNGDDVTSPAIDDPETADVLVVPNLSTEHRDDVDIDYEQVPPLGGPHDPQWLACGVYDEPLRDENAVHDLEHGTVWITYQPDSRG